METTLIILVSILSFLILALIIVLFIFLFKFLKLKETQDSDSSKLSVAGITPEVNRELADAKSIQDSSFGKFCIDHPELPAKGLCSISDKVYCELCLTKEDDIKIARKFLNLYLDNEWESLYFLNNEQTGADKLNEFIRVKKQIWNEEKLPVITQKQFKINIEDDQIEAFTMVMVRSTDKEYLSKRLEFLIN
jgi:hypothetical protein